MDVLGCVQGREAPRWIDFDFFGHQLSAHVVDETFLSSPATNPVDDDDVPVRHFGAILPWAEWHALRDRLKQAGQAFVIEPHIRFAGEPGEQATMFFLDPSGNALELKSFQDASKVFART